MRAVAGRGRAAPRAGPGGGKRGPGVGVGGDDRRAERVSQEVKGVSVRVRAVSVPRRGVTHAGRPWRQCGSAASCYTGRPPCGGWLAAWARRRPSAAHCGMRASSAPASRHKAAAWRASGSSFRPADAPSKMPHTWASRSARPAARSRSSLTAAACSSPVRSRHRAWCRAVPVSWATRSRSAAGTKRSWFTLPGSNARAIISSKLADYHGNRAVRLPWVVTVPVSFSSCTRNGLPRVSAREVAS